jgi:hypothetical protein
MECVIRLRYLLPFLLMVHAVTAQVQLVNASIDHDGNLQVIPSKNSSKNDFEFLVGDWISDNKRLTKRLQKNNLWIASESTVNNRSFLGGISNLDVSTTPINGIPFETITLRTFNPQTRLWSSYWVDGRTGITDPPVIGSFEENIGTFYGKSLWEGKQVLVMYQWDKTNPSQPQWSQSYSTDNGKTWELNMQNISKRLDSKPQVFMTGIISTDSSEFGSAFSPDGRVFYFARSVNKRSGIFFSRKVNDGWSSPERAQFSTPDHADADPAFGPDGALYFISTRPSTKNDQTKDYDIWKVMPTSEGWSAPINVTELNSPDNEFYISFTSHGDACFASSRSGGYGEEDIYFSKYVDGKFQTPTNIGSSVNTEHSEYDPFISPDGLAIIFTSSGRPDSFGKGDLYWTVRVSDAWKRSVHFDKNLNTEARDYCPYVTSDGEQFFYSTQGDIKFIPTTNLPSELRISFIK